MQKELLHQTVGIFDTSEKWNAYIELANQKENIKNYYFQKLKHPLLNYFYKNPVDGWVCESWGNTLYDVRWYLKDFGKSSLSLAIGWMFEFHMHIEDITAFDTMKINDLLRGEYSLLLSAFDRIDRSFENNTKAMEYRNYSFGSPYDSNFDNAHLDRLAWFAGNHTDEFVSQIIKKVEQFRQNSELTKMLYEVNQKSLNDIS
jgi:hypothetical protein